MTNFSPPIGPADLGNIPPLTGRLADEAAANYRRRLRLTSLVARRSGRLEVAGRGEMTLEHEVAGDGVAEAPEFNLESAPLLITHADTKRPKPGGGPNDWEWVPRAEIDRDPYILNAAARRVGELVEKTFCNLVLTAPGAVRVPNTVPLETFTPADHDRPERRFSRDGLYELVTGAMRIAARDRGFYGPFAVVHGGWWDEAFDQDFPPSLSEDPIPVRHAVRNFNVDPAHPDDVLFPEVRRADFFPPDALVLVQLTPDVVRVIEGLSFRVVPWEVGYKALTITVGQVRRNHDGDSGIIIVRGDAGAGTGAECDVPVVRGVA